MDTLIKTPDTEAERVELTGHDRCDRCGAQAYVRVGLLTGELMFCGHHYAANAEALAVVAVIVEDQRDLLEAAEKSRGPAADPAAV